jgi:cellulose synthase/poly-beta-1,6-N-acetylglucosamine synthase-like glycosyltransferase
MMAQQLFWLCLGLLVYVYVGYPLLCRLLAAVLRRSIDETPPADDALPSVSVVIAAYNEAAQIAATLENKLALDYPRDKLEILVVSDASTDGTDETVTRFADRDVRLVRQQPRRGKTAGLNLIVPETTGEVVVFSDANSLYAPDALRALVAPFSDPEVGYVTGRMVYRAPDGSLTGEGCSLYMRYENRLRAWETALGSVVGVDGGIDAVRRELYIAMRPDQLPDFVLPLDVRKRGSRVVYTKQALLYEDALAGAEDEFRMRVRVSLRAWSALRDMADLLNPFRYGLYAWQLFSHKLLRYLAPFFQVGTLGANLLLFGRSPFWNAALALQVAFYLLALLGYLGRSRKLPLVATLPYYLNLINGAAAVGFVSFLQGKTQATWQPRT